MSKPCENCGEWIDGLEDEAPLTCGDTKECIKELKHQLRDRDDKADTAKKNYENALANGNTVIRGKDNEIIYLGEKINFYRKEAHDAIHEKETFKESVRGLLEATK